MIKKIELFVFCDKQRLNDSAVKLETIDTEFGMDFKIVFFEEKKISQLFIELSFDFAIEKWRKSDYTWDHLDGNTMISNDFSPKVLCLSNGFKVVAKDNQGCWESDIESRCFRWYFYHPLLTPTLMYDEQNKRIFRNHQIITSGTKILSGLLWADGNVEEWARTPLGFVPILSFTDHSDFDTLSSLEKQREFFKENGIKVSKGFFLYDYSHKSNTASFEQNDTKSELRKWKNDGHELVYHALSQSYRGISSEKEFMKFESPEELHPIVCYIDHGYHPYNYTKQDPNELLKWYTHMEKKGIQLIWNYVDSGEGNYFSVNQLDPENFKLINLWKSFQQNRLEGISRSWMTLFRNILMYGVGEEALSFSKKIRTEIKLLKKKNKVQHLNNLVKTTFFTLKSVFNSNTDERFILGKDEIFPHSKFGPVFFKAPDQKGTEIYMFQSISVRDFDVVFSELALKKFIQEKGILIAHTYFSFLGLNHEGRLFENDRWSVRDLPAKNFQFLGQLIKDGVIWNPTITELYEFYLETKKITYKIEKGNIIMDNFQGFKRIINN